MSALSALDISSEHLAQTEALYRTVLADAQTPRWNIVASAREHIRETKVLLLEVQKARRGGKVMAVHARSHSARLGLEQDWEQTLRRLSDALVASMDLDAAIRVAHGAWIKAPATPLHGVLVMPGSRTLKSRLRKALTPPKAEDATRVERWGATPSEEAKRLLASSNPDAQVLVLRDAEGNAVGLTEITRGHGVLRVQSMVVEPGTEYGPQMMQEVARVAQKEGLGISMADVSPDAESFFKGLGMRQVGTTGGEFEWSPREAAGFATSGGTLPPPGASTAGMGTAYAQMGMQQLALNILQGVPDGAQATAADVQRALMTEREAATWINGGASQYIGLATKTADAAGQVSLEHLGLHKNWTFATPRNMAQDTFEVRGSKIIQQMYGNHRDSLTRIITDATNPTKPLSMSEVQARIKEEWPALQRHQVERIARTETGAVWMGTAANAYAANGISQFETIVATGPSIGVESEDPCDECVDMAQGVHSMDDDLPPWHPNCRCDIIPVLEDPDTGDAWLPPDEPWTGGGDESGAAETPPKPLPEPPERDMPMLPPEALPASGVAPSADIQLKGQGARDTTEAALADIGMVHNVPDYVEHPVVRGSTRNAYARDANEILLNPRPRGTGLLGEEALQQRSVVHEYAHFVQEQKIIPMNAQIEITDLAEATPEFANFARYDQAPDELFARSYQQWIAERTANEAALADYKKIGTYWSEESFKPIGAAFDKAFTEKGLLRAEPPRVPTEPVPLPEPAPLPEPTPTPKPPEPEPAPASASESAPAPSPEPHSIPMDRGGSPGMVSPAAKAEMPFRDAEAKERAREALGVIGRVIRLPADAPEFEIVRGTGAKMKPAYEGAKAQIHGLGKFYTQSERGTLAHEFGHYLDWGVLSNPADVTFATQAGKAADDVLSAIHDTDEYKALRAATGRDRTYLGSDIELFARAFEQYIGEVTGDADINYSVDVARRLENPNQFWTKETFAPIKEALDNTFRERGMLIDRVDTPAPVPAAPPVQLTIPTAEPPVTEVTSEGDPFRRYWKVPESTSEPFGITANGLTNDELGAIDRYTHQDTKGGYNVVNRWLRGLQRTSGKPLAEIQDAVAKLDTAIEKAPALDKPMTLYRGVANTDFYGGVPKVGQVIEDPAFMSTSTTPALPTSWAHTHGDIWTIEAPAGTRGINVNAALEGTVHGPIGLDPATAKEKEVILARGQRVVVDSVMPRVTEYPNGQKITAYDVKAHIETEPPPPPPAPKPEPTPEVPKEPTPAPPPPPAPTPPPATATDVKPALPADLTTKEGFETMLQHYEGRTIRVKFGGRSYTGLVERSKRGDYMTVDRSRFVRGWEKLESIEIKVGGRYKPYKEFERMTPEQQNPEPRATDSSKPHGQRSVVEPPPPEGGFKFEDAPPSMKLGAAPETPKFASLGEAKAFAETHIAAQVDFGSNPDLAGIQQALDGMAKVLRPYGIKLDRFQVEKPKGQALAIFGRGSRRITIDGVKQYFSGNIIQAQKRVTNLRDMATNNVKQREVFASNQQITREEIQKRLDNPSYPAALREDAATKLENLAVTKRWTVNHSVDDPVRALLAHESGHFLDHAYNLRNVFAENLKAEGYTYKDGLQLSEYGASQVAEVWAETTAANIVGVEVPALIQRAYEKTLATITREDVEAKIKETAERHAAVLNTQKQRERTLAIRKRVGLH